MYTFIVILIMVVCVALALAVLVQNSKGGGLAANFSAPNQVLGVRKTTETIEKITWGLAIALAVLSLAATIAIFLRGRSTRTGASTTSPRSGWAAGRATAAISATTTSGASCAPTA